ncbi:hypothetical protein MIND_00616700 [Mycena indigotica]|uniref:Uncharacterized protein n=1 Tax=Mycena indigotica TaxID=2126181 RepID=A0A8H6ST32_9AGAR|nr:uncharacterized protein MIND_00616700 [Mycena indigotica]KAF7303867.1 hypothetical protein MIND_00616700 [Mycena indigotica]
MAHYSFVPPSPSVAYVNPNSPSQVSASGPPLATWSSPQTGTTVLQYANARVQVDTSPGYSYTPHPSNTVYYPSWAYPSWAYPAWYNHHYWGWWLGGSLDNEKQTLCCA